MSDHPIRRVHVHAAIHGDHPIGRFNAWLAVKVTGAVGSMWCAYAFGVIALIGFPSALAQTLRTGDPLPLVAWFAQTFLQLVLLSVIIVGQQVMGEAQDKRAEADYEVNVKAEADIEEVKAELDRVLEILTGKA